MLSWVISRGTSSLSDGLEHGTRSSRCFRRSLWYSVFASQGSLFAREENGDLYIRKVSGQCHRGVHHKIIGGVDGWIRANGLDESILGIDAGQGLYGSTKAEPDVGIHAASDGWCSTPLVNIEIDLTHRNTRGSRKQAGLYLFGSLRESSGASQGMETAGW